MDVCIWEYNSAQFAGGPFYLTSCGEGVLAKDAPVDEICPICYKSIKYTEEE